MMKKNNRRVVLAVVLILVVCAATIGGTIAWLTDKTDLVTNTFSPSGIDISLVETMDPVEGTLEENEQWNAQLVPGATYHKDPVVSVDGTVTNVDVFLFVEFTEENNLFNTDKKTLVYTSNLTEANGWTNLGTPANVWYREVKTTDATKSWHLIDGDTVTINANLTKAAMPAANATPVLTYKAYAIQTAGFDTAADAWTEVSK